VEETKWDKIHYYLEIEEDRKMLSAIAGGQLLARMPIANPPNQVMEKHETSRFLFLVRARTSSRVPMSLRLTQGDENRVRAYA